MSTGERARDNMIRIDKTEVRNKIDVVPLRIVLRDRLSSLMIVSRNYMNIKRQRYVECNFTH